MTKTLNLRSGITAKDLRDFLATIPDDAVVYTWNNGDGDFDDVTMTYDHGDIDIDISTYNTIY